MDGGPLEKDKEMVRESVRKAKRSLTRDASFVLRTLQLD